MTTSKNTENIQGHTPLSQVPSALFRAFTRRSDLTSSQTVGRWMHEHFDFKSCGRSVVISVSSGRSMFLHRYRGLDTLRFQVWVNELVQSPNHT